MPQIKIESWHYWRRILAGNVIASLIVVFAFSGATMTAVGIIRPPSTDPETALEFLRDHAVDVLVLDIQMPGMTGFELLDRLDRDLIGLRQVVNRAHRERVDGVLVVGRREDDDHI